MVQLHYLVIELMSFIKPQSHRRHVGTRSFCSSYASGMLFSRKFLMVQMTR